MKGTSSSKRVINAYIDVENELHDPVLFQKKWFQSVSVVLKGVSEGTFNKTQSVKHLIKVRDSFNIISQNVNDDLPSEERVLLRNIFSTTIQVLNSAIKTKEFSKVGIVKSTVDTLLNGW